MNNKCLFLFQEVLKCQQSFAKLSIIVIKFYSNIIFSPTSNLKLYSLREKLLLLFFSKSGFKVSEHFQEHKRKKLFSLYKHNNELFVLMN